MEALQADVVIPAKTKKIRLDRVCRVCLTERGHLRNIFTTKLYKMMELCASIQVAPNDDLPHSVCVRCFHLVAKFFAFRKKIERSDTILRSYINDVQSPQHQMDILDIAVNEAKIEEKPQIPDGYDIHFVTPDDSIVNIPISYLHSTEIIDESNSKHVQSGFYEGPPPLVPLENGHSNNHIEANLTNNNNVELNQSLGSEPPPLVFLKKQSTSDAQLKSSELSCRICWMKFEDRYRLIRHLRGHMIKKDYLCNICEKRYPNSSTLRAHMRTHSGERPFKCYVCGKGFVRWAGVIGHMRTHDTIKPYQCECCGKSFKVASNLKRHKIVHMDRLPFCCSTCGRRFSQSENLLMHIRSSHTNERPFLCSICGKGFVNATRLKRHMWVHSGYKPYVCSQCPSRYMNLIDFKRHQSTHFNNTNGGGGEAGGKKYSCKMCKITFSQKSRLEKHMRMHGRTYSCKLCYKSFSSETLLKKHLSSKNNNHRVKVEVVENVKHHFILP